MQVDGKTLRFIAKFVEFLRLLDQPGPGTDAGYEQRQPWGARRRITGWRRGGEG